MGSGQSVTRSEQEMSNEEECHAPRPGCRCMRVIASKGCPFHSVPQLTSLVHPFGPPALGGREETGVGTIRLLQLALTWSRSRTVRDESRLGWKWERYVRDPGA